jgi:hypothetical protein
MVGPAISVPRREATKAERLVRPTALTEKLYGGAEKICERVIEIPTSHEMQVVKRRVAQSTAGEPSNTNGRKIVLKNETANPYRKNEALLEMVKGFGQCYLKHPFLLLGARGASCGID